MTAVAWHRFEVYSAVTPTTSTRFDWLATVCDHASVVPAVALVVDEAASNVTGPEAEASWRRTLAVMPSITFPLGMLKPKLVASRFGLVPLAAMLAVA